MQINESGQNSQKRSDFNKFGLTDSQINDLDMLDGVADNALNGTSLFDVIAAERQAYDSEVENGLTDSFFDYVTLKHKPAETNPESENSDIEYDVNELTEDLTNVLFLKNKKGEVDYSKINITTENIATFFDEDSWGYSEKYGQNFVQAILNSNLDNEVKKQCLLKIKDSFDEKIKNLTGDTSFTSAQFDKAINYALNDKDSIILDKLTTRYMKTLNQLERMHKRNAEVKYDRNSYMKGIVNKPVADLYAYHLIREDKSDDVYGNGYFDWLALQRTGNCWAHGAIGNTMNASAGSEYMNNLVIKANNKITVYLPLAEENGEPKPNGDGIYTYTPIDIEKRYSKESLGDGEYTAFMMAVTDYRKSGHPYKVGYNKETKKFAAEYNTSEGGTGIEFCRLIFGNEYYNDKYNTIILNDANRDSKHFFHRITQEQADSNPSALRARGIQEKFDTNLDSSVRYKNLKELYKAGLGFLEISCDGIYRDEKTKGNPMVQVKKAGSEKIVEQQLLSPHAYRIAELKDDEVILRESNGPANEWHVPIDIFMKAFSISYHPFPADIL